MLEVGIATGGSLKAWAEYLPKAQIVGIDIHLQDVTYPENVSVYEGDQTDAGFVREIAERHGPFLVVVDDGSHRPNDWFSTFQILFPDYIAPGGFYIIEDLMAPYHSDFEQGHREILHQRIHDIVDSLNQEEETEIDSVILRKHLLIVRKKHG